MNWSCVRRVPTAAEMTEKQGLEPMDNEFETILNSLPEKSPRSRLAAYLELIEELRRRGRTYRDIASILAEKCHVRVAHSTLHAYLRTHGSGRNARPPKERAMSTPRPDRLRERGGLLKLSKPPEAGDTDQFRFDASEPLRLRAGSTERRKQRESGE